MNKAVIRSKLPDVCSWAVNQYVSLSLTNSKSSVHLHACSVLPPHCGKDVYTTQGSTCDLWTVTAATLGLHLQLIAVSDPFRPKLRHYHLIGHDSLIRDTYLPSMVFFTFHWTLLGLWSRGISVSIVSDYRLNDRGSITGRGKGFFL
jgi:hypothetical protein